MRGKVKPAVAAQIDPAVDLTRRVMTFRQVKQLTYVDQRLESFRLRIVLVHKCVPAGPDVVANRRVILVAGGQAFSPNGPRVAWIILLGVIQEIDRRRSLGNLNICAETGRLLEKRCVAVRGYSFAIWQLGWIGEFLSETGRGKTNGCQGGQVLEGI